TCGPPGGEGRRDKLAKRTRGLWLLVAGAGCVLITGLVYAGRWRLHTGPTVPAERTRRDDAFAGYADPASCESCPDVIARTYRLTGMARSLSKARVDRDRLISNPIYHAASDRYYTIVERGGMLLQRRHQIGFGGKETNVAELTADFVIGSGNHAQTF